MLWTLIAILFLFWLFGAFVANFGEIVHLALVLAVILLLYNLITRGRATVT